ncbi:MAG TPA: glycosyltransferase family 39 protein, partial [Pyrinomonadaceae bacterium]|nr:glycosyltransferase family 39 protein [Pyrinomonadaceae bacterium]
IFLVAMGCRLLSWHDNRYEARKVQTAVTEGYKHTGRLLQQGGLSSFFSANSPLSDPNHLGHPPGYSILIAVVFAAFGESDSALQLLQITADSLGAVLIFLIALNLFNTATATIAGLLIALAPQFTYNSVLLLPDSLSVVPLLLAVYFITRARERPRISSFIMAGALVGLSCWLRANALLLAPFIAAAAVPLLFEKGRRMCPALALLGGSILVIAPLTIRNYIVYDHFIPISLGAGQTMLEGISDYDEERSLGIPNTDMGLMKWEAEFYQRPDYYGTLFNPDGVKRERLRLAQGFAVMRSHPFWFFGVMVRRAASMLRLERVRLISADPPVTHALSLTDTLQPTWFNSPEDLLAGGVVESKSVSASLTPDGKILRLQGDESKNQLISAPVSIEGGTDYVLKLYVRLRQGRMMISVEGAGDNYTYASTILEPQDWKSPDEQPLSVIEIPFVSRSDGGQVRIVFANNGAKGTRPVLEIAQLQLFSLGPSSFTWTRIPRAVLRLIQKLFVTALMLPLAILGLILLIRARRMSAIILLLTVPAYFMCVQSALHTEYRYVLAIHYFLFILVALALYEAGDYLRSRLQKLPALQRRGAKKAVSV